MKVFSCILAVKESILMLNMAKVSKHEYWRKICHVVFRSRHRESHQRSVWGTDSRVRLPKDPVLREEWIRFVYPGQTWSCASVFVCSLKMFNKKTEGRIGPRDKRSRSSQSGHKMASNVCVLLAVGVYSDEWFAVRPGLYIGRIKRVFLESGQKIWKDVKIWKALIMGCMALCLWWLN